MPIEIRELHIRVAIDSGAETGRAATHPPQGDAADADKDAVVAECVEQVMRILDAKKER